MHLRGPDGGCVVLILRKPHEYRVALGYTDRKNVS